MAGKRILMSLPNKDYDVTETAVPWKILTEAGYTLDFATEDGKPGECDPLLLQGVIFGQLGAAPEAKQWYMEMCKTKPFLEPLKFADIDFMTYDCLLLPGGHAKGKIFNKPFSKFFNNEYGLHISFL
jgi:putative intracellular protease/amidase